MIKENSGMNGKEGVVSGILGTSLIHMKVYFILDLSEFTCDFITTDMSVSDSQV